MSEAIAKGFTGSGGRLAPVVEVVAVDDDGAGRAEDELGWFVVVVVVVAAIVVEARLGLGAAGDWEGEGERDGEESLWESELSSFSSWPLPEFLPGLLLELLLGLLLWLLLGLLLGLRALLTFTASLSSSRLLLVLLLLLPTQLAYRRCFAPLSLFVTPRSLLLLLLLLLLLCRGSSVSSWSPKSII